MRGPRQLSGIKNLSYAIEWSSYLRNWTALQTNHLTVTNMIGVVSFRKSQGDSHQPSNPAGATSIFSAISAGRCVAFIAPLASS